MDHHLVSRGRASQGKGLPTWADFVPKLTHSLPHLCYDSIGSDRLDLSKVLSDDGLSFTVKGQERVI